MNARVVGAEIARPVSRRRRVSGGIGRGRWLAAARAASRPHVPWKVPPGPRYWFGVGMALLSGVHAGLAATFLVPDGDVAALKAAIVESNGNNEDDTIELAENGVYTLTVADNSTIGPSGLPAVTADGGHTLTINGHGAVIERSMAADTPEFRILLVCSWGSSGPAVVTLDGVVMANGRTAGGSPGNYGGSVDNYHGTLVVRNCTFRGNVSLSGGGAIYNNGDWTADKARLTIQNTTFADNSAWFGGAVVNDGERGYATADICNSTFSANTARGSGGALYNAGWSGTGIVRLGNTIISSDSAGSIRNLSGAVISYGYNVCTDDGDGYLARPTDQINTDPLLDPAGLWDNGGPTPTIALLPGSPAIDQGKRDAVPGLGSDTDQRGFPRPSDHLLIPDAPGGDGSDVGAFEVQANVPPTLVCPDPAAVECSSPEGTEVEVSVNVEDADGDTLAATWTVDGLVVQSDTVPGGGPTAVALTAVFGCCATYDIEVEVWDGIADPVTCATSVAVLDTTPPVISSIIASPDVLWPPNHGMRPVAVDVVVADACDPAPVCRIVGIASNEPENGLGDGDTAPDAVITGDLTADLRAERRGTGAGRCYTITVECIDAAGNVTIGSVEVWIPKNRSGKGQPLK